MTEHSQAPTSRFSSRVRSYVLYRPHYPTAIIPFLIDACGLTPDSIVADIGSGTGFLSELFLEFGCAVDGVEPNLEMREAGESYLKRFTEFHSIDGTAEATTLASSSIDLVTAGQAFHWFNVPKSIAEFKRILKSNGNVVIVWNERLTESSYFLREYEALLLKFGTDYTLINHTHIQDSSLAELYEPTTYRFASFENSQLVDFEGLRGRFDSSSYVPSPEAANYSEAIEALRDIFDRNAVDGKVAIEYACKVHTGKLA
jgi:SAM-dependent methyltransferase